MKRFNDTIIKIFIENWKRAISIMIFGFLVFIFTPQKTEAALDNTRVIDDSIYYNKNSMTEGQIQAFLESKDSYLKNYVIPNDVVIGPNINVKGWRASQVIYWSAQWNGLNPKVILVTLQKEQSLVASPILPLGQYSLDWAMGYACPEGSDPNLTYQGFAMQVAWGSFNLKRWSDWAISHDSNSWGIYWVGETLNIDGISVYLSNGPTAALYRYTPHIQTSFASIYTLWFGSLIKEGFYLVADVSNPTGVYLVEANNKRGVPADVYNSWNFANYPIDYISNDSFISYNTAQDLTKLVSVNGHVYFVDRGEKKGVPDSNIFDIWGFDWNSITPILETTRDYIPTGANLSFLIQLENAGTVYLVDNRTKHPILSYSLLQYYGYPGQRNISIVSNDFSLSANSSIDGFTIQDATNQFVMSEGHKMLISDSAVLNAWQLSSANFVTLSDSTINNLYSKQDLSYLGQTNGQAEVYYIENGTRRPIKDFSTFTNWGFNSNSIFKVDEQITNSFGSGALLTQLALNNNAVYLVQNNTFRPIFDSNTLNIFKDNWNLSWDDISPISDTLLASKSQGAIITFPSLVTYSNGGTVYYMDTNGKRPIQNAPTLTHWGFDWNNIFYTRNNSFLASYPSPAPLTVLAENSGTVYLIENGFKRPIDSVASFNNHATFDPVYDWNNIFWVSSQTLSSLPTGSTVY